MRRCGVGDGRPRQSPLLRPVVSRKYSNLPRLRPNPARITAGGATLCADVLLVFCQIGKCAHAPRRRRRGDSNFLSALTPPHDAFAQLCGPQQPQPLPRVAAKDDTRCVTPRRLRQREAGEVDICASKANDVNQQSTDNSTNIGGSRKEESLDWTIKKAKVIMGRVGSLSNQLMHLVGDASKYCTYVCTCTDHTLILTMAALQGK